jgi:hypothetical protein
MKLSPGRSLGVPVKTRLVSGFIFTEYLYRERAVLPRHCQEMAHFSFVLSVPMRSTVPKSRRATVTRKPSCTIPWTSTLREYELQAEESLALPNRQVSWLALPFPNLVREGLPTI